jgi:thioredoxin 1
MSLPTPVTDQDFDQEVLEADTVVLVDFWAEWCGPCKMVAPVLDDLSQEYDGKIKFTKVDVDENPETAMKYGIRSIPTMLVFKGGAPVDQVVGAVPKAVLKKRLDSAL